MIVGIDLGTTFSVVATTDAAGRPRALPNRLDAPTTPSVVHFASAHAALVGEAAAAAAPVDPDNTVALIKRQMGRDVPLCFHGVDHTPESVSAVLLRALVADARAAVALAGIELLEPVTAGLHHGIDRSASADVLVYDLGGGTFDATLLRAGPEGVEVVATDGDHALGGADVDQRLADLLLDRLARACGPDDDPRDDEPLAAACRGGEEFLTEAVEAHYRVGVVLWNQDVDTTVPVGSPARASVRALRRASSRGGTDLAPTLSHAIAELAGRGGDRVVCVFGDGDVGDVGRCVELVRQARVAGIRFVVRGLGEVATGALASVLTPGEERDDQLVRGVAELSTGIASMARDLRRH